MRADTGTTKRWNKIGLSVKRESLALSELSTCVSGFSSVATDSRSWSYSAEQRQQHSLSEWLASVYIVTGGDMPCCCVSLLSRLLCTDIYQFTCELLGTLPYSHNPISSSMLYHLDDLQFISPQCKLHVG